MYGSEENKENQRDGNPTVDNSTETHENTGYTGDTDRVNGEYHYKNGYTQKIYSDAHYAPASESTVPPRYYTPPQKPPKAPKPPKEKKNGGMTGKLIAICLVCALVGGGVGAAVTGGVLSNKFDSKISDVNQTIDELKESNGKTVSTQAVGSADRRLPSQIYAQACEQVVGISSEVTYINFFGMATPQAVTGSGFIISEDGYILTNYHVIELAYKSNQEVTVMVHDGTKYPAVIVGVEESNDIAILKIDAQGLNPAQFGDSDALMVGDSIYAVGNPLGELEFSMSTGTVSAKDRLITTEDKSEPINMFQIDAAVNHGNSGGPAYNDKGQVVGIVTAKSQGSDVEGLGFAIPINDVVSMVNDIITNGYVTGKAYMGVRLDERYNSMFSQYYNMPIGAYVQYVDPDGAADKAGIQAGDIIIKLGDMEIQSPTDLKKAVRKFSAGDTAEVTLYRAGESETLSITFDDLKPAGNVATPASNRRITVFGEAY